MKAPFVWFGGKSKVVPEVWRAFGDVDNYVEPFAGSLAVLLGRPAHHSGRAETVNDKDKYVCNFWRANAAAPDEVAHYADWPVNETDLTARHIWLVNQGRESLAKLEGDPDYYDAKIAGWWVWGINCWIGSGWCSGNGKWTADAGGNVIDAERDGVKRQRPHLGDAGKGVHRKLPHLGDAGKGVNRQRPHLSSAGQGVKRQLPFLGGAFSVNQGANNTKFDSDSLRAYMRQLADRLRRVRVCCGDWARIVTLGALSYGATVGIFLDPPYSAEADRDGSLYAEEDLSIAHEVREWAIANGENPRYRIALCGYEGEHVMPGDWRIHEWKASASYQSSTSGNGKNSGNRHRERIWFSPHCLNPEPMLFQV